MASLGSITLKGKSGTAYGFSIYARSTAFRPVGVIYVMATRQASGSYSLIYIGQTGDASERPLNHHRQSCFDKHGATLILIHQEANEKMRFAIETDLIQNYNTPCNKQ
jgi:hypothetical protein